MSSNPQPSVLQSPGTVPQQYNMHNETLRQSASLYVGDLHEDVSEALLFEVFSQSGRTPVASIRVCRDSSTRKSLGYAYVNFHNIEDAERALESLNFHPIKDIPCRVMWSVRDPSLRRSNVGNIFIKGLPTNFDNKMLRDTFSVFGSILSCKMADDKSKEPKDGKDRGFHGYVHFGTEEAAEKAISEMNGKDLGAGPVYVAKFERRADRSSTQYTNVYIKNIPLSWTEEETRKRFEEFGQITSFVLRADASQSRHPGKAFGMANFAKHEEASAAVEGGRKIIGEDGEALFVDRFQKKRERMALLHSNFERTKRESKNRNLYVKNIDDDMDNPKLLEIFNTFGPVVSCAVMKHKQTGQPRGFGFVCFRNDADAVRAMNETPHKLVYVISETKQIQLRRPLYVAIAQRKAERRTQLENYFQTLMIQRMQLPQLFYPPNMNMNMNMNMGMQQQMMYPQMFKPMPPQIRNNAMYPQQQYMRRPRGSGPGGFQGNQTTYRGAGQRGRGTGFRSQNPQAVPPVLPAVAAPHGAYRTGMQPNQSITSALINETPERAKNILGENLFPLIQKNHPEHAAKVTGMLLEMEPAEILKLLESPHDLEAKVQEALEVLRMSSMHGEH